jgi:hypothetical protein
MGGSMRNASDCSNIFMVGGHRRRRAAGRPPEVRLEDDKRRSGCREVLVDCAMGLNGVRAPLLMAMAHLTCA